MGILDQFQFNSVSGLVPQVTVNHMITRLGIAEPTPALKRRVKPHDHWQFPSKILQRGLAPKIEKNGGRKGAKTVAVEDEA